jgi:hypothetical protein
MGAVTVHIVTDSFMTAEAASAGIFWIMLGAIVGFGGRLTADERASEPVPAV